MSNYSGSTCVWDGLKKEKDYYPAFIEQHFMKGERIKAVEGEREQRESAACNLGLAFPFVCAIFIF